MLTNVPRLQTLLKLHMLGADKGRLNPIWKQKEMDKIYMENLFPIWRYECCACGGESWFMKVRKRIEEFAFRVVSGGEGYGIVRGFHLSTFPWVELPIVTNPPWLPRTGTGTAQVPWPSFLRSNCSPPKMIQNVVNFCTKGSKLMQTEFQLLTHS